MGIPAVAAATNDAAGTNGSPLTAGVCAYEGKSAGTEGRGIDKASRG